jgi:hypothetical protein
MQVASQIDFVELISSIYEYLSAIKWFEEDELRIRHYWCSPDFSPSLAKSLIARLGSGGSSKEDGHRVVCDLVEKAICIALHRDKHDHLHPKIMSTQNARSFLEKLLANLQVYSTVSFDASTFERDMVKIVTNVGNEMLLEFHAKCPYVTIDEMATVFGYRCKLEALCWIIKQLWRAQVGEDVIECFMHPKLHLKSQLFVAEGALGSRSHRKKRLIFYFRKIARLRRRVRKSWQVTSGGL